MHLATFLENPSKHGFAILLNVKCFQIFPDIQHILGFAGVDKSLPTVTKYYEYYKLSS